MDIYFGSSLKITENHKSKFLRFTFLDDHSPAAPNDRLLVLKKSTGENVYLENGRLEVLFDGYLPGKSDAELEQSITNLAKSITTNTQVNYYNYSGLWNLCIRETDTGDIWLTSDPSAMLPLYFCNTGSAFYYCSHMHIMANMLNIGPDFTGIAQKMTLGYTLGSRTLYSGITRLNSGETVHFKHRENILELHQDPQYYTSYNYSDHIERQIFESISGSFEKLHHQYSDIGLMLSEGVDSRFLGGLAKKHGFKIHSYTHSTPGAGGYTIVEKVAGMLDSEHHFQSMINGYTHDRQELEQQLYLADNLNYPYWMLASDYFKQKEISYPVIIGSSLDCILGGNIFYKPINNKYKAVRQRYLEIIRQDTGLLTERYIENIASHLKETKLFTNLSRHSKTVLETFMPDISHLINAEIKNLNDYINLEFERIAKTGSLLSTQQLQRFMLENRDRKQFFGQPLTIRKSNKIYIPSYEYGFMKLASSAHPKYKLHHKLYLNILRKFLPEQVKIKNGAYGMKPVYPRLILETSRFLLKHKEQKLYNALLNSKGNMDLSGFRSVSIFEVCGRNENAHSEFEGLILNNQDIFNLNEMRSYIAMVKDYKLRVYNHERLFRGIEICRTIKGTI